MKRVSGPSGPASTRAMMRSTRLQLLAPSKNSLKRRILSSLGAASKRAFVLASRTAQGRGWRNAEDVIKAVRPTPVENLRAAVMAVGPQQDLSVGPVCADGAHETAQESLDFLTAGPLGGPKDGGDEATLAVEHDDRLKAILVIMRVEQPQLLAAMHRVERVVDVERDSLGNPRVEEPGGTRNKDQPSPGPCAARRERSADFRAARSSIASTVPDRTATDRAPS